MSHIVTTKPTFLWNKVNVGGSRVPKSYYWFLIMRLFLQFWTTLFGIVAFFETPDLILNSQASQAVQESLCKKGEILSQRLLRLKSFHLKRDTLWKYVTSLFFFASCNLQGEALARSESSFWIVRFCCSPFERCERSFFSQRTILSSF